MEAQASAGEHRREVRGSSNHLSGNATYQALTKFRLTPCLWSFPSFTSAAEGVEVLFSNPSLPAPLTTETTHSLGRFAQSS